MTTITVDSQTIRTSGDVREKINASRTILTPNTYTSTTINLASAANFTINNIATFVDIVTTKPVTLGLNFNSNNINLNLQKRFFFSGALNSLTITNPSSDVNAAPISIVILYG